MADLPVADRSNFCLLRLPPEILVEICEILHNHDEDLQRIALERHFLHDRGNTTRIDCEPTLNMLAETCKELEGIITPIQSRRIMVADAQFLLRDMAKIESSWDPSDHRLKDSHGMSLVRELKIGLLSFYDPFIYRKARQEVPIRDKTFNDLLLSVPNLRALTTHHALGELTDPARLENLSKVRMLHSQLSRASLWAIIQHSHRIEHFELYQCMQGCGWSGHSNIHRPELVESTRITAQEILECLRPSAETLRTLAIWGRTRDQFTDFVPPPLISIRGFPNLKWLAVRYGNLELDRVEQALDANKSPISTLIRHCPNLERLDLFGVKGLHRCNFGQFATDVSHCQFPRLKTVVVVPKRNERHPAKDWKERLEAELYSTQGQTWDAKLRSARVSFLLLLRTAQRTAKWPNRA